MLHSDFLSFPRCPVAGPTRAPRCGPLFPLPGPLLLVTVSHTFLDLDDPNCFEEYWPGILSLDLSLSDVFLMVTLVYWAFGGSPQR